MENNDLNDVKGSLDGDEQAFANLVQRYQRQVMRLMRHFSRDQMVCEGLVQDVFVEVYFSLKSFRSQGPFEHWLIKIATRVGYRFWKERGKEKGLLSLDDNDVPQKADRDTLDPQEAANIIHWLFARLPAQDRLVLTLMYLEDCSIEDIASRMDWTKAAVKMRAMRAKKKIRQIAEREHLLENSGWM